MRFFYGVTREIFGLIKGVVELLRPNEFASSCDSPMSQVCRTFYCRFARSGPELLPNTVRAK